VEVFFIYSFFLAQSVYELKQRHSYVFNVVEEKALKRLKGKEKERSKSLRGIVVICSGQPSLRSSGHQRIGAE
jgi:hypothetical protein